MLNAELVKWAADLLQCEEAAVRAVAEVESRGTGFLPDGRPKILFEAHQFSARTKGIWDETYPQISSPVWNRALYLGDEREYGRLSIAAGLDEGVAYQSISMGAFQIMGFNHGAAGYGSAKAMWTAMAKDGTEHFKAFVNLVKAEKGWLKALQAKDWQTFARLYNGPGAVASYSAKMADAYAKWSSMKPEPQVPIPVADPTIKPKMVGTTVATGAVGTALGGLSVAGQVTEAMPQITDALTHVSSFQGALKALGTPQLLVLGITAAAVVCTVVVLIRYIIKRSKGDVVSR